MNREEATEALALLRKVVGQARDEAALQNWGTVWVLHAFSNAAAFTATDVLLARVGTTRPWPFVALWAGVLTFNLTTIFLLKRGTGGARSFVENQIWLIWNTFIAACGLVFLANFLMGAPPVFAGVVVGILTAVAFSMMGGLMGRRWFASSALFAAGSIAMALVPERQFTILGALWGVSQLAGGIWLIVEKRRLGGHEAARLV